MERKAQRGEKSKLCAIKKTNKWYVRRIWAEIELYSHHRRACQVCGRQVRLGAPEIRLVHHNEEQKFLPKCKPLSINDCGFVKTSENICSSVFSGPNFSASLFIALTYSSQSGFWQKAMKATYLLSLPLDSQSSLITCLKLLSSSLRCCHSSSCHFILSLDFLSLSLSLFNLSLLLLPLNKVRGIGYLAWMHSCNEIGTTNFIHLTLPSWKWGAHQACLSKMGHWLALSNWDRVGLRERARYKIPNNLFFEILNHNWIFSILNRRQN